MGWIRRIVGATLTKEGPVAQRWTSRIIAAALGMIAFLASIAGLVEFIRARMEPIDLQMFGESEYQEFNRQSFFAFADNKTQFSHSHYRDLVEKADKKLFWPGYCLGLRICEYDKLELQYCRDTLEAYKSALYFHIRFQPGYEPAPSWSWKQVAVACDRRGNGGDIYLMRDWLNPTQSN
jgi:hypothetical protein